MLTGRLISRNLARWHAKNWRISISCLHSARRYSSHAQYYPILLGACLINACAGVIRCILKLHNLYQEIEKPESEETRGMQVQHEKSQDRLIEELQQQIDQLTAENLLLKE